MSNFNVENAVFYVSVGDDEFYGFTIAAGASLYDEFPAKDVADLSVDERKARVEEMREKCVERGFDCGPLLTQNYYSWLVDGFGYTGTYEEYQAWMAELDAEELEQDV